MLPVIVDDSILDRAAVIGGEREVFGQIQSRLAEQRWRNLIVDERRAQRSIATLALRRCVRGEVAVEHRLGRDGTDDARRIGANDGALIAGEKEELVPR